MNKKLLSKLRNIDSNIKSIYGETDVMNISIVKKVIEMLSEIISEYEQLEKVSDILKEIESICFDNERHLADHEREEYIKRIIGLFKA